MDVDRVKCKTMKVDLNDVFATLQAFLGSYYVNDFNKFGRTWQVNVQADAPYRINAEVVKQFKVRNAANDMVPLGSVATVRDEVGPVFVLRYNMNTATAINGAVMPSVSSGTVIDTMEHLADRQLPRNMTYEWTELTYMQKDATRTKSLRDLLQNPFTAFVGAVVLVFLVLAALYESWTLPLSVILVVPMCLLCAIAGVWIASMDLNIFVQVGFVVLVGLASKNAILIVEFARDRQKEGDAVPGDGGGGAGAFAADHHDVVRVHPGRGAAGDFGGRRGGDAADAGHGGVQRHVGRDAFRHLPDAGVLLRGARPDRTADAAAADGDCERAAAGAFAGRGIGAARRPVRDGTATATSRRGRNAEAVGYNRPMEITDAIEVPDGELTFTFARSGGPGGQNVNKVASKAILHWDLAANTSLPADVRERLRARQRRRITTEGELVIQGQRFRDQAKNIEDCRARLREMVLEAMAVPKPRRPTRPSRGSKERRIADKRQQGQRKAGRRKPSGEE